MYTLIKLSAPGWEKEFQTKEEMKQELFSHICGICQNGEQLYNEDGEMIYESSPVNADSSIGEMLCSPCGCEFDVETPENEDET